MKYIHLAFVCTASALTLVGCNEEIPADQRADRWLKHQPPAVNLDAELRLQAAVGQANVTCLHLIAATPEASRTPEFLAGTDAVRVNLDRFRQAHGEIAARYELVAKDAGTDPDRLKAIDQLMGEVNEIAGQIDDLEHFLPRK